MPPRSDSDASLTPQQLCEEFKFDLFSHLQSMASLQAVEKKQILGNLQAVSPGTCAPIFDSMTISTKFTVVVHDRWRLY